MRGWKTILGAAIAAAAAIARAVIGDEAGEAINGLLGALEPIGIALGVLGIRAKQERIEPKK